MMPGPQACRDCGCTQDRACVTDGVACHWVQPDLCSACVDQPTADEVKKAALFFDLIEEAKKAGKSWWADSQIRQIEMSIEQDRKIAALTDLAGTVGEYLDMPCGSLRRRMFDALARAKAVL